MSTYGQSIPAKIFEEYTTLSLTRNAFAARLARMLEAVGMTYVESLEQGRGSPVNNTNALDPANAESYGAVAYTITTSTGSVSGTTADRVGKLWAFDFPTADIFTINNVAYRPFIYIYLGDGVASTGNLASSVSREYEFRQVFIQYALRPATAQWNFGQCLNWNKFRGRPLSGGFMGVSGDSSYTIEWGGFEAGLANWKVAAADVSTPSPVLMMAGRWFAYLGPAGLVVQIGGADSTQTQDTTLSANIMSAFFLFGGDRVPNRARSLITDLNLPRIDPILAIPGTGTGAYRGSATSEILGIGHDLKSSISDNTAVYVRIFNFDNLDQTPGSVNSTVSGILSPVPSPTLVNGVGRHILSRIVYCPSASISDSTLRYTYAPTNDERNTQISTWADFFHVPNARFSDARCPLGLYTDPDTMVPWYTCYMAAYTYVIALNAAGATLISTLPTRSYSANTTYGPYAIAGTTMPASGSSAVIASSPGTLTITNSFTGVGFVVNASQNYIENTTGYTTTSQNCIMTLYFDLPALDPTYRWQFQFDAYARGGTENSATQYLYVNVGDCVTSGQSNTVIGSDVFRLYPAGANTGNASYNYTTRYTQALRAGQISSTTTIDSDGRLVVRIGVNIGSTPGAALFFRVGNFTLLASKWQ